MEKVILLTGQDGLPVEVKMNATSGALYRYREQFKSDFLTDLADIDKRIRRIKKTNNSEEDSKLEEFQQCRLEIFERIAWAMAKTSDPTIPTIDKWLDKFKMFAIYEVLPDIMELVTSMFMSSQKKAVAPQEVQEK